MESETGKSPPDAEPLVGLPRHFVGRETATFSTVRKYKEVSVYLTEKEKLFPNLFKKVQKKYGLLELQTVPQLGFQKSGNFESPGKKPFLSVFFPKKTVFWKN